MRKQITIRKAAPKDVPAILELWKELMDFHKKLNSIWTISACGHKQFAEYVIQHTNSKDSCAFVATDGKKPVGYCLIKISNYPPVLKRRQYGELTNMAVTKKYRRYGIGQKLVTKVRKWCAKRGISRIEAKYSTENPMAAGFWAKAGFRPYLKSTFLEI
jgi:ribosomal protein S18 acetylase RimI-like enzyme